MSIVVPGERGSALRAALIRLGPDRVDTGSEVRFWEEHSAAECDFQQPGARLFCRTGSCPDPSRRRQPACLSARRAWSPLTHRVGPPILGIFQPLENPSDMELEAALRDQVGKAIGRPVPN